MNGISARITFTDTRPTEDACDPIVLDLLLDGEGRVERQVPAVGWWGFFAPGEDLLPFVLRSDGRLDFGAAFDPDERFGTCNVLERRIRLGEYVTFWLDGEEICARVAKVTVFAGS